MKLPFLLFLTLMSSSLAVLGQDGKWSDLPSCARGCFTNTVIAMDKYWPDGCLPVVCGFSSPDHTALKLALLYCLSESKVEACNGNGTSGMSSLVDKTIKVYCDAASRDSIAVDSVNSTGTMTTTVALVTGLVSSVLSAQWTPTLTVDEGGGQISIPPLISLSDLSSSTVTDAGLAASNLSTIIVSTPIQNSSSPTSTYMRKPPLPTLPGIGLNRSTDAGASTIYSTHVVTLSANDTSAPLTTAPNSETSLLTTTVATASPASVSTSSNAASSVKMVMRSDLWYLFESIVGLGIYAVLEGEWELL